MKLLIDYWDYLTAKNLKIEFIAILSGSSARKFKDAGVEMNYSDFLETDILSFTNG